MRLTLIAPVTVLLAGLAVAAESTMPVTSPEGHGHHHLHHHHHHRNCTKPAFKSWELSVQLPGHNATVQKPLCLQIGSTVSFTWQTKNVSTPVDPKKTNGSTPAHPSISSFRVWVGTATDQWNATHLNKNHYETRPVAAPFCAGNGTVEHGNFTVKADFEPVYPNVTMPITLWATNADAGLNSSWADGNVITVTHHKQTPIYLAKDCKVFEGDVKTGKAHLEVSPNDKPPKQAPKKKN